MTRRRRCDGCCREGVALALTCCLLLVLAGCRPQPCPVEPPDRPIEAPPALAAALQERVAHALTGPDGAILVVREEELTALLRLALEGRPLRDATAHITEEALYLQAAVGRRGTAIGAALVPAVEDGRPAVRVACLTVDGRPMPRIVGATAQAVVGALAEDAAWSVRIEAVTLMDGVLAVTAAGRAASGA